MSALYQLGGYAQQMAISARALGRPEVERQWLDVLALVEKAKAEQREVAGELRSRADLSARPGERRALLRLASQLDGEGGE